MDLCLGQADIRPSTYAIRIAFLPASKVGSCIEFGSVSSHRPLPEARLPPAEVEPAAPEIRKLAKETPSSANDADSPLRDVRLTGVVIGPDLRMAIFAVTGTNSRVLSEGEALKGWRLDSISREAVLLSGSAGNIVLKPQPDANLVPSPPPVMVQSGQPGTAMAGCAGATDGGDARYCRQLIGRYPHSDARLSL